MTFDGIKGIFEKADKLIEKGDYTGARSLYEKIRNVSGLKSVPHFISLTL